MNEMVFHLVDDNDIDIAVNSKLLQLANLTQQVQAYSSAVRFLEVIESSHELFISQTNVVLLDINMPHISGFECLERMSGFEETLRQSFHVFMLSSSIDRNDIKRAESYPMVKRILEKPLDVYQFKQALNVIFGV
jgi:CheY-like chemotaxis protein